MKLVLLFPGQGSQKPGMGKDLSEAYTAARQVFSEADAALGESLSEICFNGPAETLTLTQNAQPALLAHGAAVWAVVRERIGKHVGAAAGHSLGEFTAYHSAGTFSVFDAVRLVRRRGDVMSEAGAARSGTMAAILGDMDRAIDDICAEASGHPDGGLVVPANFNSPAQVVISGEIAGVEKAMELARAAGARRAVRLTVSGAFHSPLMAPARAELVDALASVELRDPAFPVFANVNAEPVCDAATAGRLLVDQLTSPVGWMQIVGRLATAFPDALFLELGPGSVLTGLTRKIAPDIRALPCGTVAEVEAVLATVAA